MTCEEFEELSGAYVLDAVTPEERRAAQAHLATCAKCTHLAQELSAAVSVLPLAAPQVAPSPALKERLMQAIRRENGPIPLRQPAQPARRRAGWAVRLLAAAALVLVLLTGGLTAWNVSLQHQSASLQSSNALLISQLSKARETNAAQSQQIITLQRQVAHVFDMAGTHVAQGTTGSVLYLPQQNLTVLVLHGLPRLQGTQLYQGWLLHNNTPMSIGVLSVQNGIASLTFPGSISGFDIAAVSQEPGPAPSQRAPAGPVVAAATLQHPAVMLFTI
jgi:anti-sigma-K factor RskA